MRKYETLVKTIINNVGGQKNIIKASHCLTRIRLNLKDYSLINEDNILANEKVLTAQKSGDEYQVVVGTIVADVYDEFSRQLKLDNYSETDDVEVKKKGNLLSRAITTLTKCMSPFLSVMAATGLLRGLLVLVSSIGLLSSDSLEYQLILTVANVVLMFLPAFVGYTAAKYFNMKYAYVGLVLGLALVYPTLESMINPVDTSPLYTMFSGTWFETDVYSTFFGIPILLQSGGYAYAIIPAIVSVYFASKVEKITSKYCSDLVAFSVVPMVTMIVAFPMTLLFLGPISNFAGLLMQNIVMAAYNINPIVSAIVINITYQPMVVLGIHWALSPITYNSFAMLGYDPIMACMWPSAFSIAGVCFAIWFRAKDKKMKAMAAPAAISALCHIMEPGLYGVTVPNKKYFLYCIIGATLGGVWLAATNTYNYALTGTILGVVGFINPETASLAGMWNMIIACCIVIGVPFILTLFTFKNERVKSKEKEIVESGFEKEIISSPIAGETVLLRNANDISFKEEKLGHGIAINPTSGDVFAPFDGTMSMIFPTKHSFGMLSDSGVELLLHIGIDIVNLKGDHFTVLKEQGDRIEKGELIAKFDLDKLKVLGYNMQTYIIVSNTQAYLDVLEAIDENQLVNVNEPLIVTLSNKASSSASIG
ncbi:glucose PTS transporter subunit IIA [Breznakia pachnodae]|uniref:PTS system beta-glucosides-specific IIC component n=1 Tax=Breznakia pachnodae TaxID=265178 RepID=A0ABU0E4E3_9FIRM|nr:glucose PTS transporter subunit IIA [Breznakia pachnodae]MDQ0361767.1 PTS system beta-glucosides-specific IIC component [Breznakia pachnodae]